MAEMTPNEKEQQKQRLLAKRRMVAAMSEAIASGMAPDEAMEHVAAAERGERN